MTEAPRGGNAGDKRDEDELAEYELEKYDEEDIGLKVKTFFLAG